METVGGHWNGSFDAQSRPLVRLLRYAESMLGLGPIQIEYRTVDECPSSILGGRSRSGSRSTIHIDEIHQNVPMDYEKFRKPSVQALKGSKAALSK
jgi:hypothetical protein